MGICDRCFYLRIDTNTFVGIRDFDTATKSARGFFMEKMRQIKWFITCGPKQCDGIRQ